MAKKSAACVVFLAAAMALTLPGAAPAFADDSVCTSTHTGETIPNGLLVPAGERCQLSSTTVQGNVVVQEGGALVAFRSTITGNVSANGATLQLINSSVGNHVTSVRPTNFPVPTPEQPDRSLSKVFFCGSRIGGSVSISDAPSFGAIRLGGTQCDPFGGGNTIGGSLLDRNNRSSSHDLVGNTAASMVCSGNSPAPIGSGNTARIKTGQCAQL